MWRPVMTTSYTARSYPWYNVMDIITTWFWDDTPLWQDEKLWWDAWILWTGYAVRDTINTSYT